MSEKLKLRGERLEYNSQLHHNKKNERHGNKAETEYWCDQYKNQAQKAKKLLERYDALTVFLVSALTHYKGVVTSVNDPKDFTPTVVDGGKEAREALKLASKAGYEIKVVTGFKRVG